MKIREVDPDKRLRLKQTFLNVLLVVAGLLAAGFTLFYFTDLAVSLTFALAEVPLIGIIWWLNRDIVRAGGSSIWSRTPPRGK